MKKINSKEELIKFLDWHIDDAYDIDAHFMIEDVNDYEYPLWIEFQGTTHLGNAYKIRNREEMLELFMKQMMSGVRGVRMKK